MPPGPCPATFTLREKEIEDEGPFCSTSWGHVRIVPAHWSRRREADPRRQGTRGKLAGLGQDGVWTGARNDGRPGGRNLQSFNHAGHADRGCVLSSRRQAAISIDAHDGHGEPFGRSGQDHSYGDADWRTSWASPGPYRRHRQNRIRTGQVVRLQIV